MRSTLFVTSLLASAALAGIAIAKEAAPPPQAGAAAPANGPEIGSYGFDTAGMDRSVQPGDDFFRFAGGGWLSKTEIPADRAAFGMFNVLQDRSLAQTKTILEEAAAKPGSKIGDFYASY
ncbi:MAG: peptidase M13, partial [Sphingomonas hengshuiensis]